VGEKEFGGEPEDEFGTEGREEIGLIGQPKREVSNLKRLVVEVITE